MDHDKDFAGAKRELDRAMQLNDHESLVWHNLAMWHGHLGHVEEAFAAIRRARELEPTRPIYTANYSLLLYETRRYDEAIGMVKQVIELNARFDQARSVLARALMATGDLAGALEQAQANGDSGPNQGDLGMVYAKLGRRDDALREIERLDERARRGFAVAYEQAQIYATLGDIDARLRRADTRGDRSFSAGQLDAPGAAAGSIARQPVLRRRRAEVVRDEVDAR